VGERRGWALSLLTLTYGCLLLTAALGAVLLLGYTFRRPISFLWFVLNHTSYPRTLVMVHLASALLTLGAFTAYLASRGLRDAGLDVAYAVTLLTVAVGMGFFLAYDWRGRHLRWRWVGVHILMATMTFIAATSLLPLFAPPPAMVPLRDEGRSSSGWYMVRQHRWELSHPSRVGLGGPLSPTLPGP
jgi:hypothetical protein